VATTQRDFWDVFAHTDSPMLVVDDDRVFRGANAAACRMIRGSAEDIVGHRLADFTPASHAGELDAAWKDLMQRRHVVREWSLTDVEGHPIPISVAATCDVPEPGRHLGVVLSTVDDDPGGAARPRLSQREREITRLLAQGLSGERIARELFLSPETVRTHIRNAMEHVGARTRAHLVAIALREGLISI
jgi:PAS domain S-box-containing protein